MWDDPAYDGHHDVKNDAVRGTIQFTTAVLLVRRYSFAMTIVMLEPSHSGGNSIHDGYPES